MKLVIGLGNPGIEYQFTPHNLGFLAVDRIAEQCGVKVSNRHCRALTARARIEGESTLGPRRCFGRGGAKGSRLPGDHSSR